VRGRNGSFVGLAAAVLVAVALQAAAPAQVGAQAGTQVGPPDPARLPLLLVPGWGDDASNLATLRERLVDEGWPDSTVVSLTFVDPVGSNRRHAAEVAEAVARLRALTGAPRVDILAHSMGGLAVRRYLYDGGQDAVRKVAFLATPHHGTRLAYLGWGQGAREMEPGSPFLLDLRKARPVPDGVDAITIRTPIDLHILPQESAELDGVPDVPVCCPTHAGLLEDEPTFRVILRFLMGQ